MHNIFIKSSLVLTNGQYIFRCDKNKKVQENFPLLGKFQ